MLAGDVEVGADGSIAGGNDLDNALFTAPGPTWTPSGAPSGSRTSRSTTTGSWPASWSRWPGSVARRQGRARTRACSTAAGSQPTARPRSCWAGCSPQGTGVIAVAERDAAGMTSLTAADETACSWRDS